MDQDRVIAADFMLKLADRLKERLGFDIADRTADFNDGNSRFIVGKIAVKTALDLVGDMRDDLHGPAAIIPTPLLLQNGPVNFAGGHIGVFIQIFVDKTLVMSKIQIGLRAVVSDKHFAMLNRIHRSGVNVDIGVKFLHRDFIAACFQ